MDDEIDRHLDISGLSGFEKIGDDSRQFIDQAFQGLGLGIKAEEIALLDEPDSGFGVVRGFDNDAAGHLEFALEWT